MLGARKERPRPKTHQQRTNLTIYTRTHRSIKSASHRCHDQTSVFWESIAYCITRNKDKSSSERQEDVTCNVTIEFRDRECSGHQDASQRQTEAPDQSRDSRAVSIQNCTNCQSGYVASRGCNREEQVKSAKLVSLFFLSMSMVANRTSNPVRSRHPRYVQFLYEYRALDTHPDR